MRKTIRYKKSDIVGRWLNEKIWYRGWHIVEERDASGYNAGKGILLGLLFLPLALFGFSKYIEVTYERN